jgi:hypothetical protein
MSPQLIVAAAIALGLVASHWYAYHSGGVHMHDAIIAEQAAAETLIHDTATEVRQQIGAEVAGKLGALSIVNRTINKETVREIVEKPVYRDPDCAVPVSGVVQLNAARRGEPGGTGPGADAAPPAGAATGLRPPAAPGRPAAR